MEEQEVDLRDYIRVLIKRKWIIIGIFAVAVAASAIWSVFFLPRIYKSAATLMITKPTYEIKTTSRLETVLSPETIFRAAYSLETYSSFIRDAKVEKRVLKELNLDKPPYGFTYLTLDRMLSLEQLKDTNLIKMSITGKSPELITKIVNKWTEVFIEENTELNLKELKENHRFIEEQLKIATQKLTKAEEELRKFDETNKIALLKGGIGTRLGEISGLERNLTDVDLSLDEGGFYISQLRNKLKEGKETKLGNFSILSNILFLQRLIGSRAPSFILSEKGAGAEKSTTTLDIASVEKFGPNLKEQISALELALGTLDSKKAKIKNSIDKKKKEAEKLQNQLASEELKRNRLARDVDLVSQTQKMLSQKAEEARITLASKENPVRIVSAANIPEIPIGPKRRQNVMVSGIVSLMLGIFLAFFIEYWQSSKETLEVK